MIHSTTARWLTHSHNSERASVCGSRRNAAAPPKPTFTDWIASQLDDTLFHDSYAI
jgi:hypothetical protein